MGIDRHHVDYLTTHTHGRLATVAPNGSPQNKPVVYRYNPSLGTIDIDGFGMESSAKYRNVALHPDVSFVVDDTIGPGAEGARFVELRGEAEQVQDPTAAPDGPSSHLIRIRPRRLVSWNIRSDRPGMHSEDLTAVESPPAEPVRPTLGTTATASNAAARAVERFLAVLEEGAERGDAGIADRHLAADLIWGSPGGDALAGYEEVDAIRTAVRGRGGDGSGYRHEVIRTLAPAPGVILAQVRRTPLAGGADAPSDAGATDSATPGLALYVLVRRRGTWWLAAAQSTIIRPG